MKKIHEIGGEFDIETEVLLYSFINI